MNLKNNFGLELVRTAQASIQIHVKDGTPDILGGGNISGYLIAFSSLAESITKDAMCRLNISAEDVAAVLHAAVNCALEAVEGRSHE